MTTAVAPARCAPMVRWVRASAAARYRTLLRRGVSIADVPDYLRIFDRVDIATVAARGVRLAAREAVSGVEAGVTLKIRRTADGERVGQRVSAELYAAATVLSEYLRLPATDELVTDMAAMLARDRRYARRTDLERVMLAYQLLLTDPDGHLEKAL